MDVDISRADLTHRYPEGLRLVDDDPADPDRRCLRCEEETATGYFESCEACGGYFCAACLSEHEQECIG